MLTEPVIPMIASAQMADPGAAAAVIVTADGRYLLQRRDAVPTIWFPDRWGLFGGAIEEGETPEEALLRELGEELGFTPRNYAYFTQVGFDLSQFGHGPKLRYVFEVPVTPVDLQAMVLSEGTDKRLFTAAEILQGPDLAPYDSFTLRLHLSRELMCGPAPSNG